MIATFTSQEEKILCRVAGAGGRRGTGHSPRCFELGWKVHFSFFLPGFNKSILKQQHAKNAAKKAETDVWELFLYKTFLLFLNKFTNQF